VIGLLRFLSHLFQRHGRLARRWFWAASVVLAALVFAIMPLAQALGGHWLVILAFLPIYWCAFCLMSQRCHDTGRSAAWLLILLIPIAGVLWGLAVLGFRRGDPGANQYGEDPRPAVADYLVVKATS
jgi:uncharacterized membrane protein YhaH (DUF805 family)